jgi:hypothetical protein
VPTGPKLAGRLKPTLSNVMNRSTFGDQRFGGRRGDRFIYLTWGDLGADHEFEMFRRAKVMLNRVAPDGKDERANPHIHPEARRGRPALPQIRRLGDHTFTWTYSGIADHLARQWHNRSMGCHCENTKIWPY